jgi:hypothetical protein
MNTMRDPVFAVDGFTCSPPPPPPPSTILSLVHIHLCLMITHVATIFVSSNATIAVYYRRLKPCGFAATSAPASKRGLRRSARQLAQWLTFHPHESRITSGDCVVEVWPVSLTLCYRRVEQPALKRAPSSAVRAIVCTAALRVLKSNV